MNMNKIKFNQLLILSIFIFSLPHLFFVFVNQSVWPWDQAWYGEETYRAWNTLWTQPFGYFHYLIHQFGFKAPLVSWIGQFWVPLAKTVGNPHVILISIIGIAMVSVFFMVKTFENLKWKALFCFLFLSSMPLFFGLQREYFVEPLQFLSVSILIFLSYRSEKFSFWKLFFFALFAVMIGLGAKVTTPLYEVVWGCNVFYILIKKLNKKNKGKFLQKSHLLIISFSLLVLAWYYENLKVLFHFMKEASSGEMASLYGHSLPFFSKMHFWKNHLLEASLGGRVLWFSFYSFLLVFIYQIFRKQKMSKFITMALIQIFIPLVAFSFQINEETRYLFPVLPSVVVFCVEVVPIQKTIILLFSLLSIFRFGELNLVTLNKLSSQFSNPWITHFKNSRDDLDSINKVMSLVCNSSRPTATIGVEFPNFNCNSFNFYVSSNEKYLEQNCNFHSLGYAAQSVDLSLKYMLSFNPKFFITLNKSRLESLKDDFNKTSLGILKLIENDKNWHLIYLSPELTIYENGK